MVLYHSNNTFKSKLDFKLTMYTYFILVQLFEPVTIVDFDQCCKKVKKIKNFQLDTIFKYKCLKLSLKYSYYN